MIIAKFMASLDQGTIKSLRRINREFAISKWPLNGECLICRATGRLANSFGVTCQSVTVAGQCCTIHRNSWTVCNFESPYALGLRRLNCDEPASNCLHRMHRIAYIETHRIACHEPAVKSRTARLIRSANGESAFLKINFVMRLANWLRTASVRLELLESNRWKEKLFSAAQVDKLSG